MKGELRAGYGRKELLSEFLGNIFSVPMSLTEIKEMLNSVNGQSYSALHTVSG